MEDKNICENCGHGKEKHPYTSWFGSKKLFTCKRFKPKTQSQVENKGQVQPKGSNPSRNNSLYENPDNTSQTKRCPKCKERKERKLFGIRGSGKMRDWCLECERADKRRYMSSYKHPNPKLRKKYEQSKNKEWIAKNKEKKQAERTARRKVIIPKGYLCDYCKINKAEHRHHEDYSKPEIVKLICRSCHGKTRRKQ